MGSSSEAIDDHIVPAAGRVAMQFWIKRQQELFFRVAYLFVEND